MDEIWDTLLELYRGGDGVIFETLYTSLPASKSYLAHIFCKVELYRTCHAKNRPKVSLIPIDDAANDEDATVGVGTEAGGSSAANDQDATEAGSRSPAANAESNKDADDEDVTSPALLLEAGADADGTTPAANDLDSNKNVDDEVAMLVAEDLHDGDKSGKPTEKELDGGMEDHNRGTKESAAVTQFGAGTEDGSRKSGKGTDAPKKDDSETGSCIPRIP